MPMRVNEICATQEDGGSPTILATGSAPGESGVFVLNARFHGGLHITGAPRRHHICFNLSRGVRFDCRLADQLLSHEPQAGSLAICPVGIDCAADAEGTVDTILVAIDPGRLALAAAEDSVPAAQLIERLTGYDRALLDLAVNLARECAEGYPNGPLYWHGLADAFVSGLVARHTSEVAKRPRGTLGKDALDRLRDYVIAHLAEPIEVAELASLAARSPFHFTRVFARSVGMTPHRYVVRLRLQRAIELVREGRCDLAEIAVRTGFADQSHLSRWVRRVHGVSLSQLAA